MEILTLTDILEHAKQLSDDALHTLIHHLLELQTQRFQSTHKPKAGAELVAMLKKMGPIELVDPHIEDPVEWLEAQRKKESDRLKPYWDSEK